MKEVKWTEKEEKEMERLLRQRAFNKELARRKFAQDHGCYPFVIGE